MNKVDLKNFIKKRMQKNRNEVESNRSKLVSEEAAKFVEKFVDKGKLDSIEGRLDSLFDDLDAALKDVGGKDMPVSVYTFSRFDDLYGKVLSRVRDALTNASTHGKITHSVTELVRYMDEDAERVLLQAAERVHDKCGRKIGKLDKLESELLAVVTSSKNAKEAADKLTELGIDLAGLGASKESYLPAVVILSQPACLFNGEC